MRPSNRSDVRFGPPPQNHPSISGSACLPKSVVAQIKAGGDWPDRSREFKLDFKFRSVVILLRWTTLAMHFAARRKETLCPLTPFIFKYLLSLIFN
jgi:hypothetical protein